MLRTGGRQAETWGAGPAGTLAGDGSSGSQWDRVGLTRAVEARGDGIQEGVLRRQESPHGRHLRRPWPPAPSLRGAGTQRRGREPSLAAPLRAPRPLTQPSGRTAHPGLAGPVSRPRARGRPRRRGREHGARPLVLWPPTNSGIRTRRALCTFRLRRRQQRLPFPLRVGSRSGSVGRQIPAAPSVCRGEAATSLPPSGARRLHRGNHGDRAHPSRAASLKGQASHKGTFLPSGHRWGQRRRRSSYHPGCPQATHPDTRRITGERQVPPGILSRRGEASFSAAGILRKPSSLSSPRGT